jgi:MFS family permease
MAAEKKSLDGADSIVDVVHSDEENAHDPATVYQSWDRAYRDDLERKLVRKIDKHIMPVLVLMYIMNYMDRTSVTQARLYGIQEELGITGPLWQLGISILSVPYILSQIPGPMLIARIRPSILLPTVMTLWAITSACTGATQNVGSFMAVRIFLGATEGPFFPAAIFFLSCWYRKGEIGVRIALLMSGLVTSQAFAGLISAGILQGMDGVTSISSWRWLFILEGAATVVIAFVAFFVLPDYPHSTKWLSEEERICAVYRLAADVGRTERVDSESVSVWHGLGLAAKDYRVWCFATMQMANTACISFSYFFPTLIKELGFTSNTMVLLISAAPYVLAFFSIIGMSYYTDRVQVRSTTGIGSMAIAAVAIATIIGLQTSSQWGRFAMLFPVVCGIYTTYCITYSWLSSTIVRPLEKRAAAIGITNTCSNCAVVFGTFFWMDQYSPTYSVSWGCILAFACLSMGASVTLRFSLQRENKHFDKLAAEVSQDPSLMELRTMTETEKDAVMDNFRYVI